MMAARKDKMLSVLTDGDVPAEHRKKLLTQLCMDDSDVAEHLVAKLLEAAAAGNSRSNYEAELAELKSGLQELERGPLRPARFIAANCPVALISSTFMSKINAQRCISR